jgi:hypothetical protein
MARVYAKEELRAEETRERLLTQPCRHGLRTRLNDVEALGSYRLPAGSRVDAEGRGDTGGAPVGCCVTSQALGRLDPRTRRRTVRATPYVGSDHGRYGAYCLYMRT